MTRGVGASARCRTCRQRPSSQDAAWCLPATSRMPLFRSSFASFTVERGDETRRERGGTESARPGEVGRISDMLEQESDTFVMAIAAREARGPAEMQLTRMPYLRPASHASTCSHQPPLPRQTRVFAHHAASRAMH